MGTLRKFARFAREFLCLVEWLLKRFYYQGILYMSCALPIEESVYDEVVYKSNNERPRKNENRCLVAYFVTGFLQCLDTLVTVTRCAACYPIF